MAATRSMEWRLQTGSRGRGAGRGRCATLSRPSPPAPAQPHPALSLWTEALCSACADASGEGGLCRCPGSPSAGAAGRAGAAGGPDGGWREARHSRRVLQAMALTFRVPNRRFFIDLKGAGPRPPSALGGVSVQAAVTPKQPRGAVFEGVTSRGSCPSSNWHPVPFSRRPCRVLGQTPFSCCPAAPASWTGLHTGL